MTIEQEHKMLADVREMLAMDKSKIAEKYLVELESAYDYSKSRACAVLDVVLDGLEYEIQAKNDMKHYKGVAGNA